MDIVYRKDGSIVADPQTTQRDIQRFIQRRGMTRAQMTYYGVERQGNSSHAWQSVFRNINGQQCSRVIILKMITTYLPSLSHEHARIVADNFERIYFIYYTLSAFSHPLSGRQLQGKVLYYRPWTGYRHNRPYRVMSEEALDFARSLDGILTIMLQRGMIFTQEATLEKDVSHVGAIVLGSQPRPLEDAQKVAAPPHPLSGEPLTVIIKSIINHGSLWFYRQRITIISLFLIGFLLCVQHDLLLL